MDKRYKAYEPKVVVIGGGTGLSTMLRGLKAYTHRITAIVTVADDGGGSGVLRDELGMLPPGDIRNCIQALANTEPTMSELLNYRFTEGSLAGQSFGNLFLAALNGMYGSFEEAVMKMSEVLAITGRVLPVTNEDVRLIAEFDDNTEIFGESKIYDYKVSRDSQIRRVRLVPASPPALPEGIAAVEDADMIVLGPGSLYTSIIPNLLTQGLSEAIAQSDAVRVLVLNVMTQNGETEGYTASDHIRAIWDHTGCRLFDFCLANSLPIPENILERYASEGLAPTVVDENEVQRLGVNMVYAPVAGWKNGLIRHNPMKLARELTLLFREKSKTRIYGTAKQ